jgi:WD40 repeat protein
MRGAAFTPDGQSFATTGTDDAVSLWNAAEGSLRWRTPLGKPTYDIDFSPDGSKLAVACLLEGQAALLNVASGAIERHYNGHGASVLSIRFSPDGTRILTSSSDQFVRVFPVDSETASIVMKDPEAGIRCAEFNHDGTLIASSASTGALRLWEAPTGRLLASQAGPKQMEKLAFSPVSNALVTTSFDEIRLWDSGRLMPARPIPATPDFEAPEAEGTLRVASFPFDRGTVWFGHDDFWLESGGRHLLQAGQRHFIVNSYYTLRDPRRTWTLTIDPENLTAVATPLAPGAAPVPLRDGKVFNFATNHDGSLVALAFADGTLRLYKTADWTVTATLDPEDDRGALWSLAFNPAGDRLALGWQRGIIHTVKVPGLEPVWQAPEAHARRRPVVSLAWSEDGRRIVSASSDETARVWDGATGDRVSILTGHALNLINATFSPDGKQVLTTSLDESAKLWLAETGREIVTVFRLQDKEDALVGGGFSADGRTAIFATRRGDLHVLDTFPWQDNRLGDPGDPRFLQTLETWKREQRLGREAAKAPVEW